jgi:polysaccharide deacetylase family protein (PEP-CTERM system associated)
MLNALSVDVEDYFQVSAFSATVHPSSWDRFECRAERNTLALLDLLDRHRTTATFFVLGWIAERFPGLVREIHGRGHEVASHGRDHQTLDCLNAESFRSEVREQKVLLEDLIQASILGYRAPSFSVTRRTTWALQVLLDEGYRYDSSIFPVHHDRYGIPDAPRFPHEVVLNGGVLREFPPSTVRVWGLPSLPIGGGGYLRIYPLWLTRWGLRRLNRVERQPAMVYLHPWEVDPDQPRIRASRLSRWRHYSNLDTTAHRIGRLLSEFRFAPVRTVLGLSADQPPEAVRVSDRRANSLAGRVSSNGQASSRSANDDGRDPGHAISEIAASGSHREAGSNGFGKDTSLQIEKKSHE